jgi:RNA polymerase sigma factor (sigma-70 family)
MERLTRADRYAMSDQARMHDLVSNSDDARGTAAPAVRGGGRDARGRRDSNGGVVSASRDSSSIEPDSRQYERHRAAVHALLRARFGTALSEVDRDDLYQEAWAGVLEHHRRGRSTPDLLGLLKTIAFRRGRDRLRNISADPTDPLEGVLAQVLDRRPTPEEQVMHLIEADSYRHLIDSLGQRQRTIMKLRCEWGLAPGEIQDAMGISRKAYEKQLTRAFKRLAAGVGEIEDGTWLDHLRDLLAACEAGTATPAQRAEARRLVERNPSCRAILRRMRGAAALLPLPLAFIRRVAKAHGVLTTRAGGAATALGRPGAAAGGRAIGGYALAKVAVVSVAGLGVVGGVMADLALPRAVVHRQVRHPSQAGSARRLPMKVAAAARHRPQRRVVPSPPEVGRTPPPAITHPPAPVASQRPQLPRAVIDRPTLRSPEASATSTPHRSPAGDGSQEFGP